MNLDEADNVFEAIEARSAGDSSPAKLATLPDAFSDFSCVWKEKYNRNKLKSKLGQMLIKFIDKDRSKGKPSG